MIRSILLCLTLVIASSGLLAADGEDDAPESDVGVAAESAPEKAEGQDHKGAVILKRSYPRRVPRTLAGLGAGQGGRTRIRICLGLSAEQKSVVADGCKSRV
jgi:hypothetical protein